MFGYWMDDHILSANVDQMERRNIKSMELQGS